MGLGTGLDSDLQTELRLKKKTRYKEALKA